MAAGTPGSTSKWGQAVAKTAHEATLVQKTWRGVLARRRFSELFYQALEACLGAEAAAAAAVPPVAFTAPTSAHAMPRELWLGALRLAEVGEKSSEKRSREQ